MFLTRYRPSTDLQRLHNEMNQLFEGIFPLERQGNLAKFFGSGELAWPKFDMTETADSIHITAELPGMKQEDIKVDLLNGVLVIAGERQDEHVTEGKQKHVVERFVGSFERSIALPCEVVQENIRATYDNGLLSVDLPKAKPTPKSTRIDVNGKA